MITYGSLLLANSKTILVKKRLTKIERSKINIDFPLNEIIIGLILGDAHLQCRNGNSRFIYGQSSLREHHLNYFYHIFDLFKPFLTQDFKLKPRSFTEQRSGKLMVLFIFKI